MTIIDLDADEQPLLVIKPPSRWAPLNAAEVWAFRDLLRQLAVRDLKLRYKQTALGAAWVVLQPLLSAGVFTFVFGRVAKLPSDGVPYFVFAYMGMMQWNLFSGCLTRISGSLVGNSQLISKIFFPRLVLPLSTVASVAVDFGVSLLLGVAVMAAGGVRPGPEVLLLPVWVVLAVALATGIGLAAAALMVPYRDVQYVLPFATQLLLYGTPIAYSLSSVPASLRSYVLLNPLAGLLEGFRWSVMGTAAPPAGAVLWGAVAAVTAFLGGALIFTRMEQRFADVI